MCGGDGDRAVERKKGGWGGRGFGVLLMKGGKGVPRGHVKLKSPPSVSDRCEIQVDMVDFPPPSRPPAPPRDAGARPGAQRPQPHALTVFDPGHFAPGTNPQSVQLASISSHLGGLRQPCGHSAFDQEETPWGRTTESKETQRTSFILHPKSSRVNDNS